MKRWISILIIVIIVTGLSAGGIFGAREFYFKEEEEDVKVAEDGDNVKIHYTGLLKDERVYDSWRIFDTSYYNIPKIENPEYTLTYDHGRERGEPFNFTVGEGVIEGWSENVKGMSEGESRVFEVPPEKGYGEKSEDLIFEMNRTEEVPVYEDMKKDVFQEKYGRPGMNMVVEDRFWGWDKVVISVGQERVKMRNEPEVGERYRAYSEEGWTSEIVSIDSNADEGQGVIEVEHNLDKPTVIDAERISKHKEKFAKVPTLRQEAGQSPKGEGIAMMDGDEIILDFNDEVNGTTLVFRVEIVSIDKTDG